MANKHTEITSVVYSDGQHRLCLDQVNGEHNTFAMVWRGTSKSPDGYIPRPAHFHPMDLGKLIRGAIDQGAWTGEDVAAFSRALMGVKDE